MGQSLAGAELYSDLDVYQKQYTRTEVERKLEYLVKDRSIENFITIYDDRLEMYDSEQKTNLEYTYYFSEISNNTQKNIKSWKGLKVALDPGHIGGSFAEEEMRYIEMEYDPAIKFYEGDLNLFTAFLIEDELKAKGVDVLILRDKIGLSSHGLKFSDFLRDPAEIQKAIDLISYDDIARTWWMSDQNRFDYANVLFTQYDYKLRAKQVKQYKPDLTISLHLNACFPNKIEVEVNGQIFRRDRETQNNYHLAFVPGGYMNGELDYEIQRIEFLYWLVSGKLEESVSLAKHFVNEIEAPTGVDSISDIADLDYYNDYRTQDEINRGHESNYLRRSSIPINTGLSQTFEGVSARNLYTSHYSGAVIMGEAFCQEAEHLNLVKKDFIVRGHKTSSRLKDITKGYMKAIESWLSDSYHSL